MLIMLIYNFCVLPFFIFYSLLKVKNLLECFDVILNSMDLKEWLPDDIENDLPVEGTGMSSVVRYCIKCIKPV